MSLPTLADRNPSRVMLRSPQIRSGETSRAFTTLELMLVLATVTIVLVFAFPLFATARTRSQTAECVNRLRQTGVGILLYAADHRNLLPGPLATGNYFPTYRGAPTPEQATQLYQYIWTYLNLPPAKASGRALVRLGVCPRADKKSESWLTNSKFFAQGAHWLGLNYPYEGQYAAYPDWNQLPNQKSRDHPLLPGKTPTYPFGATYNATLPWSILDVPEPAKMALIRELAGNLDNRTYHATEPNPPDNQFHCNYLFLDGRVETLAKHRVRDAQ